MWNVALRAARSSALVASGTGCGRRHSAPSLTRYLQQSWGGEGVSLGPECHERMTRRGIPVHSHSPGGGAPCTARVSTCLYAACLTAGSARLLPAALAACMASRTGRRPATQRRSRCSCWGVAATRMGWSGVRPTPTGRASSSNASALHQGGTGEWVEGGLRVQFWVTADEREVYTYGV